MNVIGHFSASEKRTQDARGQIIFQKNLIWYASFLLRKGLVCTLNGPVILRAGKVRPINPRYNVARQVL
jgi:hypothetical protein